MSYSGSTNFYHIPYMMTGDFMTQKDEERRARIIDSLLFIATYGATRAIIEDASYSIKDTTVDPCIFRIAPVGTKYVFIAVVNGRLAYRTQPMEFSMNKGSKYYVYCSYTDFMETSPLLCKVHASDEPLPGKNNLLLCIVDLTQEEPVIDSDTDKLYLQSFKAHSMDSTNPHGTTLSQDTLRVNRQLLVHDQELLATVYQKLDSSPGPETPAVVTVKGMTPVFVTAMASDATVGTVTFVINEDKTISVTNSGETGHPIQLKIEGRYE